MLLVLTAGQSDVQLVVDGVRRELRKERCALLHDEIEQRTGQWRLVDSPEGKGGATEVLPEGELALCTPKLDAVLRYIRDEDIALSSALVLETRRDASAARMDPRFAGAILAERLRVTGVRAHRCAYLTGSERLEAPDVARDAVIRREVVRRLDRAIRELISSAAPECVVVASTGGFPEVARLVEEIVRLHVPRDVPVVSLEVADGARGRRPTHDRAVPRRREPSISYGARWRALELVERGNLLGAWAVAEPFQRDEIERTWTQVVEWLACFAAALPMPESCAIDVLTHPRKAIRAALRVELALRAGDIPRAVHGTVAFFEAALWDHLGEKTSRHPSKRQFRFHVPPAEELVRERDAAKLAALSNTKQREDRDRPFIFEETADESDWYRIDDSEICAVQLAKHYLELDGLTKLGQVVSWYIRELRNDVAHDEPTPALMDDARRRMQGASLWSSTDTFLGQPLVQAVLRELGEQEPERLASDLIAEVRRRLVAPSHPAEGRSA